MHDARRRDRSPLTEPTHSRRAALGVGLAGIVALVAACGGDDDDDADPAPTSGDTSAETAGPTAAPATAAPEGTAGSTPASAGGAATGSAPTEVTVEINDFTFEPAEIQVAAGGTVTWVNNDSQQHTATATGGFDTGAIGSGESASVTVEAAGTFDYICAFHPFMTGVVTVV